MDTPRARELFKAASAITYLTAEDPPVFLYYWGNPKTAPPPDAEPNDGIHCYIFGAKLKEAMMPAMQGQGEKVRALMQDQNVPREEKMAKMKELGEQIEKELEPKLKEILTPEQLEKWQKKREEMRARGGRPPGI